MDRLMSQWRKGWWLTQSDCVQVFMLCVWVMRVPRDRAATNIYFHEWFIWWLFSQLIIWSIKHRKRVKKKMWVNVKWIVRRSSVLLAVRLYLESVCERLQRACRQIDEEVFLNGSASSSLGLHSNTSPASQNTATSQQTVPVCTNIIFLTVM